MDETIYVILKLLFDFALEVWFSIYIWFISYVQTDLAKIKGSTRGLSQL